MKKALSILFFVLSILVTASGQFEVCNSNTDKDLNDICFIDEFIGIAVGDFGTVLRSVDGGVNWISDSLDHNDFQKVKFFDENHGIIIGRLVYTTNDKGLSWTKTNLPRKSYNDVEILNDSSAIISGYPNKLYRTSNFGVDWESIVSDSFEFRISQMSFISNDIGFAAHLPAVVKSILKTTNGGRNWVEISAQTDSIFTSIYALHFIDENTGLRGGWYDSHFSRTIDGGANWIETIPLDSVDPGRRWADIFDFHISNSNPEAYYSCGWRSKIYKSIDGGISWHKLASPIPVMRYQGVFFLNNDVGWVVGTKGAIVKTSNGGGVVKVTEENADLSIQILPNPFSNNFEIHSLENQIIDEVKLYNLKGEMVLFTKNRYINTAYLEVGLYYIIVNTKNGYYREKLVKY